MALKDISEMSNIEQIHAMEALWDSLCRTEEKMPSPDWHGEILQARRKKMDSGEARFLTLEQVKAMSRK